MLYRRGIFVIKCLFFVLGSAGAAMAGSSFVPGECEDIRRTYVRYGNSFAFFHEVTNGSAVPIHLLNKTVNFIDSSGRVLRQGTEASVVQPGSPFAWTHELVGHDYAVAPGETMRTIITDPVNWKFSKLPDKRNDLSRDEYDFIIQYTVSFSVKSGNPDPASTQTRVACNYYATTWCGDGVIDTNYQSGDNSLESEDCDDGNQFNGDGCSASCRLES